MEAPVYVGSVAGEGGSGTAVTIKSPSGTAIGNLILVQVLALAASTTMTSSMTKLEQVSEATEGFSAGWFWVVATSAGEQTYSVTLGTSTTYVAGLVVYKEQNTSTPINVFKTKVNAAGSSEMKWASVTPTVANTAAVLFGTKEASGGTPATGYTERLDSIGTYLMTGENATTAATGEKASTGWSNTGATLTCQIAVAPKEEVVTAQPTLSMVI